MVCSRRQTDENKYGIGTIHWAQRGTLQCLCSNSLLNVDLHKCRSSHMNKVLWGSSPLILNLFQVQSQRAENCNSLSHSCSKLVTSECWIINITCDIILKGKKQFIFIWIDMEDKYHLWEYVKCLHVKTRNSMLNRKNVSLKGIFLHPNWYQHKHLLTFVLDNQICIPDHLSKGQMPLFHQYTNNWNKF